jgi:rare lipoprotein A
MASDMTGQLLARPPAALLVAGTVMLFACLLPGSAAGKSKPANATESASQRRQIGLASWYGIEHHGRRTASGERFDRGKLTAAHPFLPFLTMLHVTNLGSGRSVLVRVNDRGPSHPGRLIDLSEAAAHEIGMDRSGVARVAITVMPSGGARDD